MVLVAHLYYRSCRCHSRHYHPVYLLSHLLLSLSFSSSLSSSMWSYCRLFVVVCVVELVALPSVLHRRCRFLCPFWFSISFSFSFPCLVYSVFCTYAPVLLTSCASSFLCCSLCLFPFLCFSLSLSLSLSPSIYLSYVVTFPGYRFRRLLPSSFVARPSTSVDPFTYPSIHPSVFIRIHPSHSHLSSPRFFMADHVYLT